MGDLADLNSVPPAAADLSGEAESESGVTVVITAHGASDKDRAAWTDSGRTVEDTTCPLVRKAHSALAGLVASGYFPVVVGKRDHVEVRGSAGCDRSLWSADDGVILPARNAQCGTSVQTASVGHIAMLTDTSVYNQVRAQLP